MLWRLCTLLLAVTCLISVTSGADPITSEAFIFRVGTDTPLCWATILNEEWVVTAAFCAHTNSEQLLRLGITRNTSSLAYEITEIVYHPLFNANTKVNDLALVHVRNPIRLDGDVNVAQLDDVEIRGGVSVLLPDGTEAITLTNHDCRSRLGRVYGDRVTDENLCTMTVLRSEDFLGKAIFQQPNKLAAIPSWIYTTLYIHTRIPAYAEWINSVITA